MADKPRLTATDIVQEKVIEPDGNGNLHDVFHVHFTTPSGTRTHIKVPASHYTPDGVAQLMHHEMSNVEGVHALDGVPLNPPPNTTPAA